MPLDQPPAIIQPNTGHLAPSFTFANPGPQFLIIPGQVKINLADGSMEFDPRYNPTIAARQFWEALSQDYRDMLKWKVEHQR
jgi:hypothetical protein